MTVKLSAAGNMRSLSLFVFWSALWSLMLLAACSSASEPDRSFTTHFSASFDPGKPARVTIEVLQASLILTQLDFNAPGDRYTLISGAATHEGDRLLWAPQAGGDVLTLDVEIADNETERMTEDSIIVRLADIFPPAKAKAVVGAMGHSTLSLSGPEDWSFETRYGHFRKRDFIPPDDRILTRPSGWLVGGDLATRRNEIAGRNVVVSSPRSSEFEQMTTLTFLGWTLPELIRTFEQFPDHILVVGVPGDMFRGGISKRDSVFVNASLPLVSENTTSILLHELVHAAGVHSAEEGADWLVEGLAEYYSLLILHRSGGITVKRFERALEGLAAWADKEQAVLSDPSRGAATARATVVLHQLATELEARGSSIDILVQRLLNDGFGNAQLKLATEDLLGEPSKVLEVLN